MVPCVNLQVAMMTSNSDRKQILVTVDQGVGSDAKIHPLLFPYVCGCIDGYGFAETAS